MWSASYILAPHISLALTSLPFMLGTHNPKQKDDPGKQFHFLKFSHISFNKILEILIRHLHLVLTSPVTHKIPFTNLSHDPHDHPVFKNMNLWVRYSLNSWSFCSLFPYIFLRFPPMFPKHQHLHFPLMFLLQISHMIMSYSPAWSCERTIDPVYDA
jgi:hypothetical protein